jgi:hypothetical protein
MKRAIYYWRAPVQLASEVAGKIELMRARSRGGLFSTENLERDTAVMFPSTDA